MTPLTLALPKGRLQDTMLTVLEHSGTVVSFADRRLVAEDDSSQIRVMLVKNADLPTYVHHGIAGLGVCGEDVLIESDTRLVKLVRLPFGSTKMCIAGRPDAPDYRQQAMAAGYIDVATKFPRFTREYFHERNIPVEIIKLNGSVELAPLLGLAPYIVDLVETGSTLRANGLVVLEALREIEVYLVANPAYYKIHFRRVDRFLEAIGSTKTS